MPSCWLESMVLVFGQTFGLASDDPRPVLDEPNFQTTLMASVGAEITELSEKNDWSSRARSGWRQLILAHLVGSSQNSQGDRLYVRGVRMHGLTSWVDAKIESGDLALWMQLDVGQPTPGHLVNFCRALIEQTPEVSEQAIGVLKLDLDVDPRWDAFERDLRQRPDLLSVRSCCHCAMQTQLFLEASAFPTGGLGDRWRENIRDVRIRLLDPSTRAQAWREAEVYGALHPILEDLSRVQSNEAKVILESLRGLLEELLVSARTEPLDQSGVNRLGAVVAQFAKRSEIDPEQGGRLFRGLFPKLRIEMRAAEREILSRLPEILGGREMLLDPGRLAMYERFRTRSNLLGYAQSLEAWHEKWSKIYPQDREEFGVRLQDMLLSATDPVLGDNALQVIELFLEDSERFYPRSLEFTLPSIAWLSDAGGNLQQQLIAARNVWWKSKFEIQGAAVDRRPFDVLRLIEGLVASQETGAHGFMIPRSLLAKEVKLLQEELPKAILKGNDRLEEILLRAPLVDLAIRLARDHPELQPDPLQAFFRDVLGLAADPFADRRSELDYVIRYAIEARFLDERGLDLPALMLRRGCAATIRSLQHRYGV